MSAEQSINRREWTVLPVPLSTAKRLVYQHHYARTGGSAAAYAHGLFRQDDPLLCVGVAWWAPPIIGAARSVWSGNPHEVLALTRLAIAPEVPRNGASYLIGQSVKLIKADGRYRCLVTYADEWQGHTGAIYRATNWEYLGTVKGHETWIDPKTGHLISDKKWTGGVSAADLTARGYVSTGKHVKHKFRMILPARRPQRGLFEEVAS